MDNSVQLSKTSSDVSGEKPMTPDTNNRYVVAQLPKLHSVMNLNNPAYYINRELSHLQFHIRVLEQSLDEHHPLLERLRFLLIFSSNMDEFFEIRVAGLMQQIEYSREITAHDGMTPREVVAEITRIAKEQIHRQYHIFNDVLLPALRNEGVQFLRRSELTDKQKAWIKRFFFHEVMPIISPIGLDPAHPFPRLANKLLCFIVELEGKDAFGRETGMAIIPAPRSLPRIICVPNEICDGGKKNYVFLSSIIHQHVQDLFPGMTVNGCYQFRLTRNSDFDLEDEVEDLAKALKGELLSRRYGKAVRLEIVEHCPQPLVDFLLNEFQLTESELFRVDGPVNLKRLMSVCDEHGMEFLQNRPFTPGYPKPLQKPCTNNRRNVIDVISKGDVLLYHPYQSFTPVIDMLRQAAKDNNVLAIRQTLYRTGSRSAIVDALVDAARNGKEVTVVVEIRARFDEEENLELAARLQKAGAVVVYGVVGYKTHAKMMLIVRREGKHVRRYAHLGTGNYHPGTAKLYTDYSFLTADKDITNDVRKIFQQLTGMGRAVRVRKLWHAPFTLKKSLINCVEHEAELAQEGKPAHIILKFNSLTDFKLIKALYRASQVGVRVDLIVRGICCLTPGIDGLSDNISVRSIVWRFLEHTRVYYFANDQKPLVYLSSADGMVRNLDRRVETAFPVEDPKLAERVKKELDMYLSDNVSSWQLQPDGSYMHNQPRRGQDSYCVQHKLMDSLAGSV